MRNVIAVPHEQQQQQSVINPQSFQLDRALERHLDRAADKRDDAFALMRYKGRPSEQTLARDFPYVVEIVVPLGGFGRKLDTMHGFLRGIDHARGRGRREGERDITRWLIAQRKDARAFAQAFGGVVAQAASDTRL